MKPSKHFSRNNIDRKTEFQQKKKQRMNRQTHDAWVCIRFRSAHSQHENIKGKKCDPPQADFKLLERKLLLCQQLFLRMVTILTSFVPSRQQSFFMFLQIVCCFVFFKKFHVSQSWEVKKKKFIVGKQRKFFRKAIFRKKKIELWSKCKNNCVLITKRKMLILLRKRLMEYK